MAYGYGGGYGGYGGYGGLGGLGGGAVNNPAILAQALQTLEYQRQLSEQIFQINQAGARLTSQNALQLAAIEFEALQSQLALSLASSAINAAIDTQNLAVRQAIGIATKQMEMAQFMAQYREKTFNLLVQIEEGRYANTWSRMKRVAQGFKY